jgi:hypothetical protein
VSLARRLLLALWAGLLVTLGGLVTPTLFAILPDRPLAGFIAGELFRRATALSMACALALLALAGVRAPAGAAAHRAPGEVLVVAPAALLALGEYGVRPLLAAARAAGGAAGPAFIAWHAVAALLYVAATLGTVALLVRELRRTG